MASETIAYRGYALAVYPPSGRGRWRVIIHSKAGGLDTAEMGDGTTRDDAVADARRIVDTLVAHA